MTSVTSIPTNPRTDELINQIFSKVNQSNGCFLHELMTLNSQEGHLPIRVLEISKRAGGSLICGYYDEELWKILLNLFNENKIGVDEVTAEPGLMYSMYLTSGVMFHFEHPLMVTRRQLMSEKTYVMLLNVHAGRRVGDGAFVWVDKAAEIYNFHWNY
jgi:hypothetical protein